MRCAANVCHHPRRFHYAIRLLESVYQLAHLVSNRCVSSVCPPARLYVFLLCVDLINLMRRETCCKIVWFDALYDATISIEDVYL